MPLGPPGLCWHSCYYNKYVFFFRGINIFCPHQKKRTPHGIFLSCFWNRFIQSVGHKKEESCERHWHSFRNLFAVINQREEKKREKGYPDRWLSKSEKYSQQEGYWAVTWTRVRPFISQNTIQTMNYRIFSMRFFLIPDQIKIRRLRLRLTARCKRQR